MHELESCSAHKALSKCLIWNITLRMRRWREVSDFSSQKFRLTPGVKLLSNDLFAPQAVMKVE